jgi:hypothetical protein
MKIFLKLLFILFIITGCTQKKYSVQQYDPSKNSSSFSSQNTKQKNTLFDAFTHNEASISIAIVFPSHTIGKYALEASNSVNTYLIDKNQKFDLKVYDIVVQNKKNLLNAVEQIKNDNITKVIAMITKEDLKYLNNISGIESIKFYLPLINKNDITNQNEINNLNVTYGAISYIAQFEKLIEYAKNRPIVEFYGDSGIGRTLHKYLKDKNITYAKKIDDDNGRYQSFLEENRKLDNSAVILNTPIVKSSILLSAINAQESMISTIMSTQLNYTPLLFSLTQKQDREKLIVANSIGKIPQELEEYNHLTGNNLNYSWVNYSTIIGVEYLLNNNIDIFEDLTIEENQVIFPVNLYKVGRYSFSLIK